MKYKIKLVALIVISFGISACGSGSDGGTDTMSQIQELEKSGAIPTLNRDYTLTGIDSNGNGVRDDIDTYIDGLSDTAEQKASLRQMSASFTAAITVDTSDKEALRTAAGKITRGVACIISRYDGNQDVHMINTIRKYTINTPERYKAYADYNMAITGIVTENVEGDGCE